MASIVKYLSADLLLDRLFEVNESTCFRYELSNSSMVDP